MPLIPQESIDGYQQGINTENDYLQQARSNATQAQAQAATLMQQRAATPGLPADAYQSLALGGADPTQLVGVAADYVPQLSTPTIRTSALDKASSPFAALGLAGGAAAQAGRPGAQAVADAYHQYWANLSAADRAQKQAAYQDEVQKAFAADHLQPHGGGGWSFNPFSDIANAASDIADGVSTSWSWGKTLILRPIARYGSASLSYGWDVAQNLTGMATGSSRGDNNAVNPKSVVQAFGSGTSFGNDIEHGSGTGWLSNTPDNQRRLNAIQIALRGYNGSGTGPAAFGTDVPDIANVAGRRVFGHDLISPGTIPYAVVSGLSDLLLAREMDPANLVFEGWHGVTALHGVYDVEQEARDAGAINAVRNMVNPVRFDKWLQSGNGQRVVAQLSTIDSAAEIARRTHFKMPAMLVKQLADAHDPAEVESLLRDVAGTELKYVPTVSRFGGLGGVSYGVRQALGDPRWLNDMPDRGILVNNPDQGLRNVYLVGKESKLPQDIIDARMNEFIDFAARPDIPALGPNAYKGVVRHLGDDLEKHIAGQGWFDGEGAENFANDLYKARSAPDFPDHVAQAVRAEFPHASVSQANIDDIANIIAEEPDAAIANRRVLDYMSGYKSSFAGPSEFAGTPGFAALGRSHMSPEASRRLTRFWSNSENELTTRAYDTSTPWAQPQQIKIGDTMHPIEGPFSLNEHLQNYIPLPDARALRRATTAFPNILKWAPGDHIFNPYLSASGEERIWLKMAEGMTSLYKGLAVLTRPAVTLRALIDGMFAGSLDGVETWGSHPLRNIADMIASHSPEPIAKGLGIFGERPAPTDIFNHAYAEDLADRSSAFSRASAVTNDPLSDNPDRTFVRDYKPYQVRGTVGSKPLEVWGRDLSRTAREPIDAQVAEALRRSLSLEGTTPVIDADLRSALLDQVKERYWSGDLSQYRESLAAGGDGNPNDFRGPQIARDGADNYIDAIAERVSGLTANDPELLDAISRKIFKGKPIAYVKPNGEMAGSFGTKGALDKGFVDHLSNLRDNGLGPTVVRGKESLLSSQGRAGIAAYYDKGTDWLFQHTLGIPTQRLLRNPMFDDVYWKEVNRLIPAADDDARSVIAGAMTNGDITQLPSQVSRSGYLTAAEVDLFAKNTALDKIQQLLYDAHARNNLADQLRIIAPFAEVWRQDLVKYTRLGIENAPRIVRRLGQLNGDLKQSSLMAPDPVTGKEMLHIPVPGWAQEAAGALATGESAIGHVLGQGPFVNSVGAPTVDNLDLNVDPMKLSLLAQGLPGIGPVASIPADAVMRYTHTPDSVRQALLPYGPTDLQHGVGNALVSTYTPTWLHSLLNASQGQNAALNRQTMADTISYLHSNDPKRYDNSPGGRSRLLDDAIKTTHNLWIVKAISQAVSPASPSLDIKTKTNNPNARWVELEALANDWYATLQNAYAHGGSSVDATREFLDRWGPSAGLAMTNETQPRIYGLAANSAMTDFRDTNPDLVQQYGNTWPLLVGPQKATTSPTPPDGLDPMARLVWEGQHNDKAGIDYTAIQRQIGDNERTTLNPQQRLELADFRLGTFAYDYYRNMVGANPTHGQQLWLDRAKAIIGARFPGYGENAAQWPVDIGARAPRSALLALQQPNTHVDTRGELIRMAEDPKLQDNPMVQGLQQYLTAREQAIAELGAAQDNNPGAALGSKRAAPLRAWLAHAGAVLVKQYPQFGPVWDSLFRSEVTDRNASGEIDTEGPIVGQMLGQ